jgi:DNA mismatch repair ATPase MutS
VETFLNDEPLREDIVAFLKRTHDSQRIVQKISMGRGDPDDMVALAKTIVVTNEILERLREANHKVFAPVVARVNSPTELAERILNAIDEEGLMRHQIEAADVAATVSEPPTPQDVAEANKAAEELFEEVVEAGAGRKKNRKKRISQGIENSLNRAMMSESDSDDAWIMKKRLHSSPITNRAFTDRLETARAHCSGNSMHASRRCERQRGIWRCTCGTN